MNTIVSDVVALDSAVSAMEAQLGKKPTASPFRDLFDAQEFETKEFIKEQE